MNANSMKKQAIMDMITDVSEEFMLPEDLTNHIRSFVMKSYIKDKLEVDLRFVFGIIPN